MLYITCPSKEYLKTFKEGLLEMQTNSTPYDIYCVEKALEYMNKDFEGYFESLEKGKSPQQPEGWVPSECLWLMDNDKFIGLFDVRHHLNDFLRKQGGHIAYQIIPSERKKGYVKKGLKLVLEWCRQNLNLEAALLCCSASNTASYNAMKSVMFEMGGYERPMIMVNEQQECSMWIKTEKRYAGKIRTLSLAVIRKGNKVLAMQGVDTAKNEHFYRLPGGGIEFGEKAEEALKREMKEELGLDVIIQKQLGVVENLFEFNQKKGHEIVFVFEATLSEDDLKKDKFSCVEEQLDGLTCEFVEIMPDNRIYPNGVVELLNIRLK